MHSSVKALFEKYQIPVSDRVCGGEPILQPVWNGMDLALFWCKTKWNRETDVIDSTEYIPLSDHDLLHEIAHWVVAAPEQRDLPEYGLGAVAYNTYHIGEVKLPDVVGSDEGSIQERLCWFVCCYWGMKHHISSVLSAEPGYAPTWEVYLNHKIQESLEHKPELSWEALIRFDRLRNSLD